MDFLNEYEMPNFIELFYSQPDLVQAAWILAVGILLAALLAVFFARFALRSQLKKYESLKESNRSFSYKKELYADAIAALTALGSNITNWANPAENETTIAQTLADNMAKISRLQLVCREGVLKRFDAYYDAYLMAYLDIAEKRLMLALDKIEADQVINANFNMLAKAAEANKELHNIATEIIILLRQDLDHPISNEKSYREFMADSADKNYHLVTNWIKEIKVKIG